MPRRRIFDEAYGSAKAEQGKPGGKLPPPMTSPPVPLSMQAPTPMPPGQGQGQGQGPGPTPMPEGIDQLLQQLLARFGGANG